MRTKAEDRGPDGASSIVEQNVTMTTLLTEQDASALLRVTVKALQGWRYRGAGPRYVKVGRCVRYRREDLQTFVLAALRTSTSDLGATPPSRPRIRVEPLLEKTGRSLTPVMSAEPAPRPKPR